MWEFLHPPTPRQNFLNWNCSQKLETRHSNGVQRPTRPPLSPPIQSPRSFLRCARGRPVDECHRNSEDFGPKLSRAVISTPTSTTHRKKFPRHQSPFWDKRVIDGILLISGSKLGAEVGNVSSRTGTKSNGPAVFAPRCELVAGQRVNAT